MKTVDFLSGLLAQPTPPDATPANGQFGALLAEAVDQQSVQGKQQGAAGEDGQLPSEEVLDMGLTSGQLVASNLVLPRVAKSTSLLRSVGAQEAAALLAAAPQLAAASQPQVALSPQLGAADAREIARATDALAASPVEHAERATPEEAIANEALLGQVAAQLARIAAPPGAATAPARTSQALVTSGPGASQQPLLDPRITSSQAAALPLGYATPLDGSHSLGAQPLGGTPMPPAVGRELGAQGAVSAHGQATAVTPLRPSQQTTQLPTGAGPSQAGASALPQSATASLPQTSPAAPLGAMGSSGAAVQASVVQTATSAQASAATGGPQQAAGASRETPRQAAAGASSLFTQPSIDGGLAKTHPTGGDLGSAQPSAASAVESAAGSLQPQLGSTSDAGSTNALPSALQPQTAHPLHGRTHSSSSQPQAAASEVPGTALRSGGTQPIDPRALVADPRIDADRLSAPEAQTPVTQAALSGSGAQPDPGSALPTQTAATAHPPTHGPQVVQPMIAPPPAPTVRVAVTTDVSEASLEGAQQLAEAESATARTRGPGMKVGEDPVDRLQTFTRGAAIGSTLSAYGNRGHQGSHEQQMNSRRDRDDRDVVGSNTQSLEATARAFEQAALHVQPAVEARAPEPSLRPQVPLPSPVQIPDLPDLEFARAPVQPENASISLQHPDLGPIQLQVHRTQGRVEVHALIESQHAEAVLRANESGIRYGVQQSGMTLGALRVRMRDGEDREQPTARGAPVRRRRMSERQA